MMLRSKRMSQVLLAVALAGSLAACAGKAKEQRLQYQEQPVEQLYNRAADLVDQRRWAEAATAFEEVERQHPYSSWARRSMLMTAYAKYQSNQYDEAIEASRRFIQLHPGNEGAPYAYYLVALCNFEQIMDVGRDQKTTELTLDALNDVVRRFPQSDYARDARLKIDMTYDQLAGKEMEVGRFYLNREQHLSAVNRFRKVIDDPHLQTTSHVPEALHRLVEAYLSLGLVEEAQKSAAILGYNFPGDKWYERTYALMGERGVAVVGEPEARRRGWLSRTLGRVF
ncbi:MAG: putative lipoprotein [Alphaproteobacteria bacterium]|nr:MAG: putative lipoprotein [Caulobacteraceae bacterium]TPW01887.1 MAG: putative lipoprotein [Alphaproteobacteria bacterium]